MADTDTVVVGGKHAALWERMRKSGRIPTSSNNSSNKNKRRPQMIHRRRQSEVKVREKEASLAHTRAPTEAAVLPRAISMTSSQTLLDDTGDESTCELVGIQIEGDVEQDAEPSFSDSSVVIPDTGDETETTAAPTFTMTPPRTTRTTTTPAIHTTSKPSAYAASMMDTSFVSASSSSSSSSKEDRMMDDTESLHYNNENSLEDIMDMDSTGIRTLNTPQAKATVATSSNNPLLDNANLDHATTPFVLWNHWKQEQHQQQQHYIDTDNDHTDDIVDDVNHGAAALSLLEHSIISNDSSANDNGATYTSSSPTSHHTGRQHDESKLSALPSSYAESSADMSHDNDDDNNNVNGAHTITSPITDTAATSPLTAMRRNSVHQALQESQVYVKRIHELEDELMEAKASGSNSTGASPQPLSGSAIVDSSAPANTTTTTTAAAASSSAHGAAVPSALLERNKTLVKEVKFAEQTCVELSQRNVDLEQQVQRLQESLTVATHQVEDKQHELIQANRECATLQAEKDAWQTTKQRLQQELRAVQQENDKLRRSSTSRSGNSVAEKENYTPNADNTTAATTAASCSPTSQVLAKALQTQLERGYSDNDKLVQLERQLAESQQELQDTRRKLEEELARNSNKSSGRRNGNDSSEMALPSPQQDQNGVDMSHLSMSSELELAHAQAKLASVSKELQQLRVAESSARHALSRANEQMKELQQRRQEIESEHHQRQDNADPLQEQQVVRLQGTLKAVREECRKHEANALQSSSKIRSLEQQLVQARDELSSERKLLQQKFKKLTQAVLGNMQRQSLALDEKVKARTQEFKLKIDSLSFSMQYLQDSLDFQSETGSNGSDDDDDEENLVGGLSAEEESRQAGDEEKDLSHITVLNATFHQSQNDGRSFHEEMLLEQMEEARPAIPNDAENADGHEVIDDLSFIAGMSHLYEDLSALLMQDPASPGRDASADAVKLAAKSTPGNASSAEKSSIQCSLEGVEQDFLKLRAILERARNASSQGNHNVLELIEEQSNVIHSLEQKLVDFADEAAKSEAHRSQLNMAVQQMSKAHDQCQAELEDKSKILETSQVAEAEAKSEIQQTLQGLLQKLQEKESAIAELRSDKERLATTIRHLTVSSEELVRNREDTASQEVTKLQGKLESLETQLTQEGYRCEELTDQIERLQKAHREHEATIRNLEESNEILATSKTEIAEKYDEASSILRAMSREREQRKKEVLVAKGREEEIRREVTHGAETISAQNEQLAKIKVERDDALAQRAMLSETVHELTNTRSALLLDVEKLKGELDYLKVSYITCNDKLADASEQNANKDELVAKLRSSNRAAKEAISSYEGRVSRLNAELEKYESERGALKRHFADKEKELEAMAGDFAMYKSSMEEQLSERHDLIEVVQSTAEALKCTYEHKLATLGAEHETLEAEVNQVVTDFMNDFHQAFSDSMESLSQLGFSLNDGENDSVLEPSNPSWSERLKAASEMIPPWKQAVAATCQVIHQYQGRLDEAEEKIESLANDARRFKDGQSMLENKLDEQERYSENLVKQLRRAEFGASKSAKELTEMSETFAATKRELSHVSHLLADQRNLKEKTEELIAEREDAEARVFEMTKTLVVLEEKVKRASDDVSTIKKQVQEKDEVNRKLESKNASLHQKCERLRDYIRKLTNKCEEWASHAEIQTEVIRKAKERQRRLLANNDKAEQQQQTATHKTPHASSTLPQQTNQEANQWSVERKMLYRVNTLVDNDDLDELASELRNFGLK